MSQENSFEVKMEKARAFVGATDVSAKTAFPPAYEFLWRRNIKVRPPLFQVWWKNALFLGLGWSLPFTMIMSLWQRSPTFFKMMPVGAVLFGGVMALILEGLKKKINVPAWEDL
jgi:hypothetical protein